MLLPSTFFRWSSSTFLALLSWYCWSIVVWFQRRTSSMAYFYWCFVWFIRGRYFFCPLASDDPLSKLPSSVSAMWIHRGFASHPLGKVEVRGELNVCLHQVLKIHFFQSLKEACTLKHKKSSGLMFLFLSPFSPFFPHPFSSSQPEAIRCGIKSAMGVCKKKKIRWLLGFERKIEYGVDWEFAS